MCLIESGRGKGKRTYIFLEATLRKFMKHATKEKIDQRRQNQANDKHIEQHITKHMHNYLKIMTY